jgi:23S rRNA (cytidine2498-2'-O)-methyltransferase
LGAQVLSVDKAPLDPRVAAMPGVEYMGASAFGLNPAEMPAMDWLFSDIICYPDRLLRLVHAWRDAGKARNFVCTIKFQGATDHAAVARFLEIPRSRAFHLYNNKHEITWVCLDEQET